MNKKIYAVYALLALLLSTALVSCDIKNPTEGLAVIVKTIPRQTVVTVNISDTDGRNVSSPLLVKFAGKDAAKVINEVNSPITSASIKDGNLVFSIKDGTVISEASPVSLVLQISAVNKDYLDIDYPVTIKQTGSSQVYVKMVSQSQLKAAGIDKIDKQPTTGTANPTTGAVTSPISVTTAGGTSVNVPTGTVLKDASGAPLSGNLAVSALVYTPSASNLIPVQEATADGKTYQPQVGINVAITDQNGKTAASASGTTGTVNVPMGNVINTQTGQIAKAGDEVAVFVTDGSGNTTLAGNAVLKAASANNSQIRSMSVAAGPSFDIPLIWLYLRSGGAIAASQLNNFIWAGFQFSNSGQKAIQFTFPNLSNPYNVPLELVSKKGGFVSVIKRFTSDQSITHTMPFFLGTTYDCYVRLAGSPIEVSNHVNVSSASSTVSLNINLGQNKYYSVFIQGKCPNEKAEAPQRINPNAIINVTSKAGISYGTINLVDGRGGIYLQDGEYTLSTTYDNTYYSTRATVSGSSVAIETNKDVQARTDAPPAPAGTVNIWYYILTSRACN